MVGKLLLNPGFGLSASSWVRWVLPCVSRAIFSLRYVLSYGILLLLLIIIIIIIIIIAQTRTLVRCEAIITQLVFEHSLRIRVKAETEKTKDERPATSPETPTTPVAESTHESTATATSTLEGDSEHSRGTTAISAGAYSTSEETVRASSSSVKSTSSRGSKRGKDKAKKVDEAPAGTSSASNLVGRINNLVTTDLGNIVDARDLMFVVVYIPLQILLCITFLYIILGWRCVSAFTLLKSRLNIGHIILLVHSSVWQ